MKRMLGMVLLTGFFVACMIGHSLAYEVTVSNAVPGNAYIPKGTLINAELISGVNSVDNDVSDVAYFRVLQNVVVNGVVVLPSGTVGNAVVTAVKRSGYLGREGGIEMRARYVQALNGAVIPLTLDIKKYGGKDDKYLPYLWASLYELGYTKFAVFSGALRGADQEIASGTKFQVAVDYDTDLGCTPDRLPFVMVKLH
ncbi:MAG: hypothetical protein P4N59_22500 [Negativicutes bacterium]|nr:hypothetical protein [Negativicutes bacterium]